MLHRLTNRIQTTLPITLAFVAACMYLPAEGTFTTEWNVEEIQASAAWSHWAPLRIKVEELSGEPMDLGKILDDVKGELSNEAGSLKITVGPDGSINFNMDLVKNDIANIKLNIVFGATGSIGFDNSVESPEADIVTSIKMDEAGAVSGTIKADVKQPAPFNVSTEITGNLAANAPSQLGDVLAQLFVLGEQSDNAEGPETSVPLVLEMLKKFHDTVPRLMVKSTVTSDVADSTLELGWSATEVVIKLAATNKEPEPAEPINIMDGGDSAIKDLSSGDISLVVNTDLGDTKLDATVNFYNPATAQTLIGLSMMMMGQVDNMMPPQVATIVKKISLTSNENNALVVKLTITGEEFKNLVMVAATIMN